MRDLWTINAPKLQLIERGDDGAAYKWRHKGKNYGIIASFGGGWDHVSVDGDGTIPSWDTMVEVKNIFFKPDEVCVEYHPAESDYVNIAKDTLHIWRPQNVELPTPPIKFV